ncbi:hypothetical protein [Marinoscillum pacificum]|uniref:hypothetical protein n=1 Tax=Marinoscillum pacificum TaxID=392723 RepID=UPI002156F8E5|nr:hypothetical protein [Marinoscillum pacificum]
MNRKYVLILFFLMGVVIVGYGQSTRDVNTPKAPAPRYQAFKKEKKGFMFGLFKKKQKPQFKTYQEESEDFRERVSAVLEQKAKEERKMNKARYTNPLYFGHKKPPKKRKNGKKKFCKECGLWH